MNIGGDLESPRHLVLFNRNSLHSALKQCGYTNIRYHPSPGACRRMFKISYAIEHGLSDVEGVQTPLRIQFRALVAQLIERFDSSRREFLTISATKPCPS